MLFDTSRPNLFDCKDFPNFFEVRLLFVCKLLPSWVNLLLRSTKRKLALRVLETLTGQRYLFTILLSDEALVKSAHLASPSYSSSIRRLLLQLSRSASKQSAGWRRCTHSHLIMGRLLLESRIHCVSLVAWRWLQRVRWLIYGWLTLPLDGRYACGAELGRCSLLRHPYRL